MRSKKNNKYFFSILLTLIVVFSISNAGHSAVTKITNETEKLTVSLEDTSFLLGTIDEDFSDVPENPVLANVDAPDSFDWRNVNGKNYVTSITNQHNCGSCVAFGTIAVLESVLQITSDNIYNPDLSESHLFFCGGGTCGRGWMPDEAVSRLRTEGVAFESCLPYDPYNLKCNDVCDNWWKQKIEIKESHKVQGLQMKEALYTYGPLVTTFDVYHDFLGYTGGIYEHSSGGYEGGHCVAIVGYNDDPGYWICKNSWGPYWGESGYFKIKYGNSGIDGGYYMILEDNSKPDIPYTPYGTNYGRAGDVYEYRLTTDDPENNGVFYKINWGDGTMSDWLGPYGSGDEILISKAWSVLDEETYEMKVQAMDVYGFESSYSSPLSVTIYNNQPYIPQKPTGPVSGPYTGEKTYSATGYDPDDDQIYYMFDWGDGTMSNWLGPYDSGEEIQTKNTWDGPGNYQIRVKIKDEHESESGWSEPLSIGLPKSRIFRYGFSNIIKLIISFFF